jgi:hypothetical protein
MKHSICEIHQDEVYGSRGCIVCNRLLTEFRSERASVAAESRDSQLRRRRVFKSFGEEDLP